MSGLGFTLEKAVPKCTNAQSAAINIQTVDELLSMFTSFFFKKKTVRNHWLSSQLKDDGSLCLWSYILSDKVSYHTHLVFYVPCCSNDDTNFVFTS